ncbi:hypothetical protein BpHYR1_042926 [Brachionus plicatilis]|uniref:Uncharacterized protein n=1 Tax=Brachionus plicatilis TaxID=10195 RepID=A0A3M7QDF6_BRAPC|nr:hypothetical protein BpHYR1_042926 [Brachionus plicatilis]
MKSPMLVCKVIKELSHLALSFGKRNESIAFLFSSISFFDGFFNLNVFYFIIFQFICRERAAGFSYDPLSL